MNEPSGCRSSPVWDRVTKGQTRVLQEHALPNQIHPYIAPTQFDTTKIYQLLKWTSTKQQSATVQTILSAPFVSQS
jgi:hypothetical protein